jgi:hypothetical protein
MYTPNTFYPGGNSSKGSSKALQRLFKGSSKALQRLFKGSSKALQRLFKGSLMVLLFM